MRRTWKGKLARVNFYFLEGNNALIQFKQVVYVCTALKLLGVSLVWVVSLAPCVYAAHVAAGWLWIRHGWYKQMAEVPVTDAVNPILMWQMHMLIRMYKQLGIPLEGVELNAMPPEFKQALSSFAKHGETAR